MNRVNGPNLTAESASQTIRVSCRVADWIAWAPGVETKEQWISWAKDRSPGMPTPQNTEATPNSDPSISFLPIGLRKKLSGLTKISLWLAHTLAKSQNTESTISTVFASRHGESAFTVDLLREITETLPLSPMAFSRSVHNTASGIFGISEKNRSQTTAIAAMKETFEMGLIQSVASLPRLGKVLYVMADDAIPEDFAPYVNEDWGKYGVALLLEPGAPHETLTITKEAGLPTGIASLRSWILGQSIVGTK